MEAMYNYKKLEKDLRKYLEENELSIREFSRMADVNAASVSTFLQGRKIPGMKVLTNIIEVMGEPYSKYVWVDNVRLEDLCSINFDTATVGQIDAMIEKLKNIRRVKLEQQLQEVQPKLKELYEQELYIKQQLEKEL